MSGMDQSRRSSPSHEDERDDREVSPDDEVQEDNSVVVEQLRKTQEVEGPNGNVELLLVDETITLGGTSLSEELARFDGLMGAEARKALTGYGRGMINKLRGLSGKDLAENFAKIAAGLPEVLWLVSDQLYQRPFDEGGPAKPRTIVRSRITKAHQAAEKKAKDTLAGSTDYDVAVDAVRQEITKQHDALGPAVPWNLQLEAPDKPQANQTARVRLRGNAAGDALDDIYVITAIIMGQLAVWGASDTEEGGAKQLEGFKERFRIGKVTKAQPTQRVDRTKTQAYTPEAMPDKKEPGYVIAAAGGPDEKTKSVAQVYKDKAFKGADDIDAGTRMSAVIGVNAYEKLDKEASKAALEEAVGGVVLPSDMNVDAFGFLWEPQWYIDDKPEPIAKVREAIAQLDPGVQATAARDLQAWSEVGQADNLPYGIFREQVTASPEIQKQVSVMAGWSDPVYIHSADPDAGSLEVPVSKDGVLHKYDQILTELGKHPLLVVGGYNFWEFDPESDLTFQLTMLANILDRAIRLGISEVCPEAIYPTEPNMLMKARSEKDGFDFFANDDLFQDSEDSTHRELKTSGSLWGHGAREGAELRSTLMDTVGKDMQGSDFLSYHPSASINTDTKDDQRGFRVSGMRTAPGVDDPQKDDPKPPTTPSDEVLRQAQSYADVDRIGYQYALSKKGSDNRGAPRFSTLSKDGSDDRESQQLVSQGLSPIDTTIRNLMKGDDAPQEYDAPSDKLLDKVQQEISAIVKSVIEVLTSEELKDLWVQLREKLAEVEQIHQQKQRELEENL